MATGQGGGGGDAQRIMTQPINLIFRFLQQRQRVQVWLFGQTDMRMEGRIAGRGGRLSRLRRCLPRAAAPVGRA
jgi:hypothetical protein